jgi:membrane protein implicated in regulation of membrane protease activity
LRPLNSTTLTVTTTLLLVAHASCLGLMYWKGPSLLWVIAAIVFFVLAVLLLIFGWVLPRMLGSRRRESEDQGDGVPTNRAGTIRAEANFTKESDGGISFETSLSASVGEEADGEEDGEDQGSDGA